MAKAKATDDPTAPRDDDLMCDAPDCTERAVSIVHDDDGTAHGRCATHVLFGVEVS